MLTKHLCFLIPIKIKGEVGIVKHVYALQYFTDLSKAVFLLWIILSFMFHVCFCYAVLSVPCSLVITCCERVDLLALLALLCCVFLYFSFTFPYGEDIPGNLSPAH